MLCLPPYYAGGANFELLALFFFFPPSFYIVPKYIECVFMFRSFTVLQFMGSCLL